MAHSRRRAGGTFSAEIPHRRPLRAALGRGRVWWQAARKSSTPPPISRSLFRGPREPSSFDHFRVFPPGCQRFTGISIFFPEFLKSRFSVVEVFSGLLSKESSTNHGCPCFADTIELLADTPEQGLFLFNCRTRQCRVCVFNKREL